MKKGFFIVVAAAVILAAISIARAGLMVGHPVDSVFNNGRSQLNVSDIQSGGGYPFINALKSAQAWYEVNTIGGYDPSKLNTNGYPTEIVNGGVATVFFIPLAADRPGDWRLTWEGTGTVTANGGGGSATNGDFTFEPSEDIFPQGNRVVLRISSGTDISNIQFFHEDDEALLNSGEIFTTQFLDTLRQGKWGVIRFLGWQGYPNANITNVVRWSDRKPLTYAYWAGDQYRADIYGGSTTNSGDDYSVAAPSAWSVLADGVMVTVKFNANSTGVTPTLNVGATGAKTIRDSSGDELDPNLKPVTGRYATLVYSATLDCWLKWGGDGVQDFDRFLINGIPIEVMVALCEKIGAYPWFVRPYMTADPITDWLPELATYMRDNAPPWMKVLYEVVPNETWNASFGFPATRFAWNMADAHWGVSTDANNWVGKVASTGGEAVSVVYDDDRERYQVIVGVHTHGDTAPTARLASTLYVSEDGGDPAYDWVTHIAPTNYYRDTYTDLQRTAAATAYASADPAGKLVIATAFVNSTLTDLGGEQYQFSVPRLLGIVEDFKDWAQGLNPEIEVTFYEGGWSPDYTGNAELDALYEGSKHVDELDAITLDLYDDLVDLGEFPSHLSHSGPDNVWSLWDPTIFADDPSPQVYGITEFNSN